MNNNNDTGQGRDGREVIRRPWSYRLTLARVEGKADPKYAGTCGCGEPIVWTECGWWAHIRIEDRHEPVPLPPKGHGEQLVTCYARFTGRVLALLDAWQQGEITSPELLVDRLRHARAEELPHRQETI